MLLMMVPIVRNMRLAVKLNPHLIWVENTRDGLWKDTWARLLFLLLYITWPSWRLGLRETLFFPASALTVSVSQLTCLFY